MGEKQDIIAIGESLIELSTSENLTEAKYFDKYFGGDTLTTAVTALRLGSKTGFISRIGVDCFRDYLIKSWKIEGLDISQIKEVKGTNGLYMVSKVQDCSAKEFSYYRKKTAATGLSIDDISPEYIQNSSLVYSTGMTQSLSISAREAVKKAFEIARENNILTAYAPNYTSLIWTEEEAQEAFEEISEFTDIIFVNAQNDFPIIMGDVSVDNLIKYLWDKGISVVIIKSSGEKGYYAGYQGNIGFVQYYTERIVDNTGAGDAFNGAVLHGIVSGMPPYKAVNLGSIVAGLQVQSYGAIKSIPSKDEVYRIFKGQNE